MADESSAPLFKPSLRADCEIAVKIAQMIEEKTVERKTGFEPATLRLRRMLDRASHHENGAEDGIRTRDPLLGN
jgi:hypothetical protein